MPLHTPLLWLAVALAGPGSEATVNLEPSSLRFGAIVSSGRSVSTAPQTVFVEQAGDARVTWTATSDQPWLEIQPASGKTPAAIRVALRVEQLPGVRQSQAIVTVTVRSSSLTLPVTVTVSTEGQPPVGAIDLPEDHSRFPPGAIRLAGWALDDVGVVQIEVCRTSALRSSGGLGCDAAGGRQLATAAPYTGIRPDVAATFGSVPHGERGGWSVVMDTAGWTRRDFGTFPVQVVARDLDGRASVIGMRSITVDPDEVRPQQWPWKRLAGLCFLVLAAGCAHLMLWFRFRPAQSPAPRQAPTTTPIVTGEWIAIAGILMLAAGLALRPGGGLVYDELYTYTHFVGRVAPWTSAPLLGVGVFNNHVAYSWLASITAALLGARDPVLRLPAAVIATLAVFAVWRFTRTFATRVAALLAAWLLALSPMHLTWAHAARGYSGLALMAVVSSAAFFRLLERPSRATAGAHALSTAATIYFHLYGVWVAAVQYGLYASLTIQSRIGMTAFVRLWQSFLAVGVLVAALYGPVLVVLLDIMGGTKARARTAIQVNFPIGLFDAIMGTTSGIARGAAVALLLVGLFRLRRHPLRASYVVLLLCVPLAVAWLLLRPQDLYPRFFHFWTPMACVLMGVAVAGSTPVTWTWPRALQAAGAAGLLLPVLAGWIPVKNESVTDNGYRAALLSVKEETRRTRTILIGPDATLLRYYLAAAPPVVESADEVDQMMRDDPSPIIVLSHEPGWSGPEHLRMTSLLERRCRATKEGLVVTYRCL